MPKNITIQELQHTISTFADERKWAETYQVYGIFLNMIEEISEAWNVVKHLEKDETLLRKVITDSKDEMEDFIGDITFLLFKLSHVLNVDVEKAITDRLVEFEKRFPAEFMKANSFAGNRRVGGVDNKYENK